MNHRYVALFIFACTFATLSPLRTHAASLPAVVLSEIQWGGSALSTADEWIELANTSSESVDVSSWKITGVASQGAEITLPAGTILPSHTTYLVANYALGDAKTVLAVSPNLVSSSVSISNSSLMVTLVTADGILIDSYSDQETPGIGSSSPPASAERNLEDGLWFTAVTSLNILTEETLGSPGYALFPALVTTPVEEEMLLEIEIQEETLLIVEEIISSDLPESIVSELSSPEIIVETDLSAPEDVIVHADDDAEAVVEETDLSTSEEAIVQTEEILVDTTEETALETDRSVPPIEEVIILIAPVSSDVVTSSVEEVSEEIDDRQQIEDVLDDDVTTITKTLDYSPLRVTEFLSSPSEGNEWIEIWNSGTEEIVFDGVTVTDASKKITILSGVLDAGDYVLVENPKGKLNNTDDTITLTLPDGQVLFTLAYGTKDFPASKKGNSAGMCSDGWHTDLVPSPTTENSCPTITLQPTIYDTEISNSPTVELSNTSSGASPTIQGDVPIAEDPGSSDTPVAQITTSVITDAAVSASEKVSSASEKSSSEKVSSKSTILSVELRDLEGLPSGQYVEVTGVVIAEPGVFGKRIAYLDGVQLYFHKATWPSLPLGTSVRIVGTWDYDGDSRRIKISDASDIEILGSETVEPASWDNVSAETVSDILVTASGTLTKKEGDVFIFSSLTGKDFRVVDEAETGSLNALRAGDHVTVTGILLPSDGTWILAPRNSDDIALAAPDIPTQEISSPSSDALTTTASFASSTPIIGGGILASSVSALGYWFFRSKKLSFLFS
ncbi:MAG: lamin tail domain-containing protein [Patescibacteria group bacterium]